jgi:flagellar biosynthesis chaperone FliJ
LATTKEQVDQWDQILDEYESTIGLSKYIEANSFAETELNEYFTMNRDSVEKLTPEDCAQISYRLAQYAFFIQRTLNREIARHNWAEESIKETIADEINNYKGYGFLEKSLQAIKHNEKASGLSKIKKYAQQRMDRLSYLANSIKNLSDIMLSVQRTKVKHG